MLSFRSVTLEDREGLLPLLLQKDRGMEYTFSNIYVYRQIFDTKVAYHEEGAVILFGSRESVLMPLGHIDPAILAGELPVAKDGAIRFACVTEKDTELLLKNFSDRNVTVIPQDDGEYVYRTRDLAELKGKKYHSKRNFCSRFERMYPDYSCEVIGPENLSEVAAMNEAWYAENAAVSDELDGDRACTTGCLADYEKLGLRGALLRCSGKVVAWCCGEGGAEGVFFTHVEKALREAEGAYAVINRDFARMLAGEYDYINREDDAGDEGLRRAKMSYHPSGIVTKNTVVIR